MVTISCQIMIQVNEGIAKFFTFMVEGDLNNIIEFNVIFASSWDICIHHETWKGIA